MPAATEIESGREGEGGKEGDRGEVRGIGGGSHSAAGGTDGQPGSCCFRNLHL